MKRVRLKSPADLDYLQALEWYEERQPGLGQEFDAELLALFERIKQNPELLKRCLRRVMRLNLPDFF